MELSSIKNISNRNSILHKLDGRVKTILFLSAIIISACLTRWYLVASLWLIALAIFPTLKLPWKSLFKRLLMPFSIAWIVFINLLFTNGSHKLFTFSLNFISLTIYSEGVKLGFLILLRIMTAVTIAALLSYSTPMIEILETLRICKLPNTIIDLAAMMYRYVFLLEDTAKNMHRAQLSRLSGNSSWLQKIKDTGNVAAYVLTKSLDRSIKIYNSMLARGYCETSTNVDFFTNSIPKRDKLIGTLIAFLLISLVLINIII